MKIRNFNKIGIIFIILVFSLSCISISYSGWTDNVDVHGYISTWEVPASIGDYVWEDADRNGIQDVNEFGLSNVIVNLYKGNGDLLDSTLTDGEGYYSFVKLTPGEYYVEFITPTDYYFSPWDSGSDDNIDSDAEPISGKTVVTFLSPDDNDRRWDAGMYFKR